jgi:hypothetical protein
VADAYRPGLGALFVRLAALLLLVLAATWLSHEVRNSLNLQIMPENEQKLHRMLMMGMVAYILLMAIPFVPGAEIGIAMLTAFGAAIAPLVYAATIVALMLAYLIGRIVPVTALARLLSVLRLRRAADLVSRVAPLSREARLAVLLEGAPDGLLGLTIRHRYIFLALAVNVPGNSLIGGGGGIMLLAGMSGLFAPLPTALAIMIAVSPVPLVVILSGL